MRALLEHHQGQGPQAGPATLIYRARTTNDLVHRGEIDNIAQADHIDVHYAVGDPGGADDVFVNDRLREVVADIDRRDIYLCGPDPFMKAATASLLRRGVPLRPIHAERCDAADRSQDNHL